MIGVLGKFTTWVKSNREQIKVWARDGAAWIGTLPGRLQELWTAAKPVVEKFERWGTALLDCTGGVGGLVQALGAMRLAPLGLSVASLAVNVGKLAVQIWAAQAAQVALNSAQAAGGATGAAAGAGGTGAALGIGAKLAGGVAAAGAATVAAAVTVAAVAGYYGGKAADKFTGLSDKLSGRGGALEAVLGRQDDAVRANRRTMPDVSGRSGSMTHVTYAPVNHFHGPVDKQALDETHKTAAGHIVKAMKKHQAETRRLAYE